jgi:HEAT repeat protein
MQKLKALTTSQLLEQGMMLSRLNSESHERSDVVDELLRRGDLETFDAAKTWCSSQDATEREFAADLLGQLGEIKEENGRQFFPYTDQSVPLLEALLDDSEARVVAAAITSIGNHYICDPILARPSLADHPSSAVRLAVACSVKGDESKLAADLLIKLSGDAAEDVRDWATFGLGTQSCLDMQEIRAALFRCLDDEHFETRCEALVGLARRKDARTIPFIKKALRADWVGDLVIEAAGYIASPDLVTALEDLPSWWEDVDKELFEGALNRCKGLSDPEKDFYWAADDEIVVPDWARAQTNC